jgi:hypothetical protein
MKYFKDTPQADLELVILETVEGATSNDQLLDFEAKWIYLLKPGLNSRDPTGGLLPWDVDARWRFICARNSIKT